MTMNSGNTELSLYCQVS